MIQSHISGVAIAVLFCLLWHDGMSQISGGATDTAKADAPSVSWVRQFPAVGEQAKRSTLGRVYDFLVKKNRQKGLVRPVAVLPTGPDNFCVIDQGSETIFNIDKNKAAVLRCMKKKENYFTSLVGACTLPGGQMLFSDSRLNKVYRVDADGRSVALFNDTLQLQQPTGLAYCAATGQVWVVETGAHCIAVLDGDGKLVKTIGSRGGGEGQFNFPTSIWIDKESNAYVVDAMNFRVQIFDKTGTFISAFGEAGDGSGSFARPKGIATDTYGNIYVVDALFNAIQVFDRRGTLLYNFGRQGRDKGEFWMPSGIYIDVHNYIYVADNYNARVQVFQLINGG